MHRYDVHGHVLRLRKRLLIMHKNTKKVAICGVMGALSIVVMLLGGIFPLATFCAPAIAGILIMPIVIEYGGKSGILLYISISLLSVFIAADKEMAFIFIFFLGYYPLLKTVLEKIKPAILKLFIKLIIFNAAICSMYALLMVIFPVDAVMQQLEGGWWFIAGLLFLGNITFIIYDFAVARIVGIYCSVWREKLLKMF